MENSGKQNPKMGFKSPTEQRRKSNKPQETTPSIDSLPMVFSVADWNRKNPHALQALWKALERAEDLIQN